MLLDNNYTPIILSRYDSSNVNFETRKTDYSYESLMNTIYDVNAFIHLASVRGITSSFADYIENLRITENVYRSCYESKIYNVVFSSSIAIFSDEKELPWKEGTKPSPISAYGISKLCCEHIGDFYNNKYNMSIKNLRFPPVYGVVSDNDQIKGRMINTFIQQAFNKEMLKLNVDSNGYREFLYVKDAVRAIISALKSDNKRGSFNIGSNEVFTNLQIAELINDVFNNSSNLMTISNNSNSKSYSAYFNCEKAKLELGFIPIYSMKEAMYEIYGEMK